MADPLLPALDMMADSAYRITLHGKVLDQATVNKFWYLIADQDLNTLAHLNAIASQFWTNVGVAWPAAVSEHFDFLRVEVQSLRLLDRLPGRVDISEESGTIIGECVSPFASWTLGRQTAVRGRHGRGSVRIAGVSENDVTNGRMSSLSGIGAKLDDLREALFLPFTHDFGGAVGVQTLTPYLIKEGETAATHLGSEIVRSSQNLEMSTQRSRRYGHGS